MFQASLWKTAACNTIARTCSDLAVKSEKLSTFSELVLFPFLSRESLVCGCTEEIKLKARKACMPRGMPDTEKQMEKK